MTTGFRLSPQQRQIWRHLNGSNPLSPQGSLVLEWEGALDVVLLRQALEAHFESNEIFAVHFRRLPGVKEPLQMVGEPKVEWPATLDWREQADAPDLLEKLLASLPHSWNETSEFLFRCQVVTLGVQKGLLLFAAPRLCFDAYSALTFFQSVAAAYANGGEPLASADQDPDGEPPPQFIDFAEWFNENLEGPESEKGLAHWRKLNFERALRGSSLPRLAQGTSFVSAQIQLPKRGPEHCKSWTELAQQKRGGALKHALQALWVGLLARLDGRSPLCVAGELDGRSGEAFTGVLGPIARRMPLCYKFEPETRFQELLHGTIEGLDANEAWQENFSWDHSERPDEQRCFPLAFESCAAFESDPNGPLALRLLALDFEAEPFDFKLRLLESADGITPQLLYDASRFRRQEAQQLADQYLYLMEQPTQIACLPLSKWSILPPEQRDWLLYERNNCKRQWEGDLLTAFGAQVAAHPERTALQLGSETLSFVGLERQSNRLAQHLLAAGIQPGQLVGILLNRSLDSIVALFAVLKAGAAFLPLDLELPDERLSYMLEDSQAAAILTRGVYAERLELPLRRILIDADLPESTENPRLAEHAQQAAYAIYTSGSTGRPKGVLVERGALFNHVNGMRECFDLRAGDRMLQFSALHFDASLDQILPPLLSGATVVMRGSEVWSPSQVLPILREIEASHANFPTSYWHLLVQEWEGLDLSKELPKLRALIAGGERMLLEKARQWQQRSSQPIALINAYGPTETTITATAAELSRAPLERRARVPIGSALANRAVYCLDNNGEPAPIGVPGELYIGGESLARGYLGRPEQTASAFLPDPFSKQPGARMYRTGDLAVVLPDDSLECLGRADNQVKIRGYRIELGEIEHALSEMPAIRAAAVVVRSSGEDSDDKRLLACYVLKEGENNSELELRAYLQARLPDYMLPALYLQLDQLPQLHNGKLDRASLETLPLPEKSDESAKAAARGPIEEMLLSILEDLLEVERMGPHDNFFERGGHSLMAMRLLTRISKAFGVSLGLQQIFANPEPASLAARILERQSGRHAESEIPLLAVARDQDQPLSYVQQGLYTAQMLRPESTAFNAAGGLRLSGVLNADAIEAALATLVKRHESLRTRFVMVDGEPRQRISPFESWSLPRLDYGAMGEEQEQALLELVKREAFRPFDLEKGPVFRSLLVRLSETEHVLIIGFHHIVSDGWSLGIFIREMTACYSAQLSKQKANLPELAIQYIDFAVWQRKRMDAGLFDASLAFWRKFLADAPAVIALPYNIPRSEKVSNLAGRAEIQLEAETLQALKQLARKEDATLFMVLYAGFAALYSGLSGAKDLVVGTDMANRDHSDLEPVLGFFINQLALRTKLEVPNFRALLNQVRGEILEAYQYREFPFDLLVQELASERSASVSPIFQIKFTLQNMPTSRLDLQDLAIEVIEVDKGVNKYDLQLNMWEADGILKGMMDFKSDYFEPALMTRFLADYEWLLQSVCAEPELELAELALKLEEREKERRGAFLNAHKAKAGSKFQKTSKRSFDISEK